MSDPKLISPMLDQFAMGAPISSHDGVRCCPAMPSNTNDRYIVKIISIPATQVQLEALLLTGAFKTEDAARAYFKQLADTVEEEVQVLSHLSKVEGFLPYEKCQIVPMEKEIGYDVYLLSPYKRSLERYFRKHPMTHLAAVNLGLDICAALAVCRQAGWLMVDLKPGNIFITPEQTYKIGDLGFISLDSLKYASLPDRYRSEYTAPEIADAFSTLNGTIDVYAAGLILYQAYNGGVLPFDGPAPADVLPPPVYADYEMAEIILRACDPNPEARWQDPIQMGQALVGYMQRNGANDVPIIPPTIKTEETVPVEEPVPEASPAAAAIAETDDLDQLMISELRDLLSEPTGEDIELPDSQASQADKNVNEEQQDDPANLSFMDVLVTDDTTPDESQADDIQYSEVSTEVSDILAQADELIAHETPDGVISPEAIDIPVPEPLILEDAPEESVTENPDNEFDSSTDVESSIETEVQSESTEEDTAPVEDETEDPYSADDPEIADDTEAETKNTKHPILRVVITLLILALLAGAAYCGYHYYTTYYQQTIRELEVTGAEDYLTVSVTTDIDESLLTVICIGTHGGKQTASLNNGIATFTDLSPNTLYTIRIEMEGFHKLLGPTTDTYTTPQITEILSFSAITGSEDGSVLLDFSVTGMNPEKWVVYYSTEGEEEKSTTFTGHSVTISGLTIGKSYTFRLDSHINPYIIGNDQITYTASSVIYAEQLAVTACRDNSITVDWNTPDGISVDSWDVRCYNNSGFDKTITVTETTAVISEIDSTLAHTVEVTANGMTVGSRCYVAANAVTITSTSVNTENTGELSVSWEYTGPAPTGNWLLLYRIDNATYQEVVRTDKTTVTIPSMIPNATYDFTLQLENGSTVFDGVFQGTAPAADIFNYHKVTPDNLSFKMCRFTKEGWTRKTLKDSDYTTTFKVEEQASFLVFVNRSPGLYSEKFVVKYIIHDENGVLISCNESSEKTWKAMWNNDRYCELDVPSMPEAPGKYTMRIFFNGAAVCKQDFTINAGS